MQAQIPRLTTTTIRFINDVGGENILAGGTLLYWLHRSDSCNRARNFIHFNRALLRQSMTTEKRFYIFAVGNAESFVLIQRSRRTTKCAIVRHCHSDAIRGFCWIYLLLELHQNFLSGKLFNRVMELLLNRVRRKSTIHSLEFHNHRAQNNFQEFIRTSSTTCVTFSLRKPYQWFCWSCSSSIILHHW